MIELFLIFVVLWNAILTFVLVYLWLFMNQFFPKKSRGLAGVLEESVVKSDQLEKEVKKMHESILKTAESAEGYYQKMGLVRFNPFERVGGEQSYSLALLDNKKNGVVMTFLYTHEGVRTYVKLVERGQGKGVELSKEEENAIVQAQ